MVSCWRQCRNKPLRIVEKMIMTICVLGLLNAVFLLIKWFHPSAIQYQRRLLSGGPISREIWPSINPKPTIDVLLPVLVFACNRSSALRTHVEALIEIRRTAELNPIIISLDCHDNATIEVAKNFSDKVKTIIELPDLGPLNVPDRDQPHYTGHYRIARHYGYSLNYALNVLNYEAIIITEDDLDVSPDFLDYFQALYPLLLRDKTLYCISAWNDNGMDENIERQATLLHRSDFFPGLGWLLTKTVWNEIKANWPKAFWDDWLRSNGQRRDRACIRPEVSRTGMLPEGEYGVSVGENYNHFLKRIIKNTDPVDWKSINVSYLLKDQYDSAFQSRVNSCAVITVSDLLKRKSVMECAQIRYGDSSQFTSVAKFLGIMSDIRSGLPRTSYRGVVRCRYQNTTIYVTPDQDPWMNKRLNI